MFVMQKSQYLLLRLCLEISRTIKHPNQGTGTKIRHKGTIDQNLLLSEAIKIIFITYNSYKQQLQFMKTVNSVFYINEGSIEILLLPIFIWVKVFENGQSEICGRQPLKKFEVIWPAQAVYQGSLPQILLGSFLNTLNHILKFFFSFEEYMSARKKFYSPVKAQKHRCSSKQMLLKISQNSQKKTCVKVFIYLISCRPAILLKRLQHRYFPVNFEKF